MLFTMAACLGSGMGLVHDLRKWYSLNWCQGKAMRENGAEILPCPHCGAETPVYQSDYGNDGWPMSFSVCLWCNGAIEYSELGSDPHEPYLSTKEAQTH